MLLSEDEQCRMELFLQTRANDLCAYRAIKKEVNSRDVMDDAESEDSDSSEYEAIADVLQMQGRPSFGVPIVLDTGFHSLKAGFAGDIEPTVVIPTVVGKPRHQVCFQFFFTCL